ncbi:MAG: FtsW/RodA/SpoVE family cell cycle protein [Lentisphaeria bacterium]|nr:FtsW/RodA/SpoVE family cell cycle protein [Lentisphaeria bacterium]
MTDNNGNDIIERKKQRDYLPLMVFFLLLCGGLLGCVAIYSTRITEPAPLYFALRQLYWLGAGALLFILTALVPFRFYKKNVYIFAAISALMLIAVLFCGYRVNGMRGWLALPGGFYFQPSEIAKAFFLLSLASFASKEKKISIHRFFLMLGFTFFFVFLLIREPDFGSAAVFFVAFLIVAASREGSLKAFLLAAGALLVSGLYFIFRYDYAFMRILSFFNPDGAGVRSWHMRQFQYTLANGGWFGSEHMTALWARSYLPLPHTDSLFASVVELSGFAGSMLVILIFAGLGIAFTLIAWNTKGKCGRLYVFCAGMLCFFQALLHISVNSVLLPATGVTLPMLSYGGSSLFSVMLSLGIALSAASEKDPDDPVEEMDDTGNGKSKLPHS